MLPLVIAFAIAAVVYYALRFLQYITRSADEPPSVENHVPFLGPLIGMIMHKSGFYMRMRNKYGYPIYTMRMFTKRVYVLNSTSLITAAQKQYRALNFIPIMANAIGKIAGVSEATNKIMIKDQVTDNGFLVSFSKAVHYTLAPGTSLDDMNRSAVRVFANSLDDLHAQGPQKVAMHAWVRSQILRGTTDAVYGPKNPFRDPSIEEAWYTFEPGVTTLALRLFPSFLTNKIEKARDHMVAAFTEYFRNGDYHEASELVRARYKYIVDRHQIRDLEEVARLEVAGAFAIIANTVATAFWVLYHIFSDRQVLEDCRRELLGVVQKGDGDDETFYLDIGAVKASCPILQSTLHECLRYHGVQISLRKVMEDHRLDGQHLLKKGSAVMMPATVQHFDQSVWGPNAGVFDHKRFVQASMGGNAKPGVNRAAFRGFGGGHHLCPGRHFATTEILTFAALAVLRFDMAPTGEDWGKLDSDKLSSKGSAVTIPNCDIDVMMCPRNDGKKWAVSLSGSEKGMDLGVE